MIGRGAYGKPWFPGQMAAYLAGEDIPEVPSMQAQRDIVLEHYEEMLHLYGEQVGVRNARKHIGWYTSGMYDSAAFRHQFNKILGAAEAKQALADFYDKALEYHVSRSVH